MVPPPGFNLTEWQNNKNAVIADLQGQVSLTNNKLAQNQADYATQSQQLAEQNQQLNQAVRNQRFVG
jgi:peptidoglycan hydrolase CwlO-like protein